MIPAAGELDPRPTVPATGDGEEKDPSNTGDSTILFVILAVMTMAAPAVLVLKKKYF